MYKRYFKRVLDVVLSGCGIVVLLPVWLLLAVVIKLDDPGTVLFTQKRIAQDKQGEKQYFTIYLQVPLHEVQHSQGSPHPSTGEPGAVHHPSGQVSAENQSG